MKIRRKQRNWNKIDPVEYFRKNYPHIKKRKQLSNEDCGLYRILWLRDKFCEVLPETRESREHHRVWLKKDAVKYFHEHYSHVKSRGQLQKKDRALYGTLSRIGRLKEVLAETFRGRDWTKTDPVKYFRKYYRFIIKTRHQLRKKDPGLLHILTKTGKLDEVFPERQKRKNWSKEVPVEFFRKNYSHIKTRAQLRKEDSGLLGTLQRIGKLDEVLPHKRKMRDWKSTDPVEYFRKHMPHIKSRRQLYEEDQGLYCVLLESGMINDVLPVRTLQNRRNVKRNAPLVEVQRVSRAGVRQKHRHSLHLCRNKNIT